MADSSRNVRNRWSGEEDEEEAACVDGSLRAADGAPHERRPEVRGSQSAGGYALRARHRRDRGQWRKGFFVRQQTHHRVYPLFEHAEQPVPNDQSRATHSTGTVYVAHPMHTVGVICQVPKYSYLANV